MKYDPLALQAERRILLIRQHRVMLDYDLAVLYGVEARALNQAVKRNLARFPADFMFRLNRREFEILRSRIGTSSSWGGRRHLPYAFTEHGVAIHDDRRRRAGAGALAAPAVPDDVREQRGDDQRVKPAGRVV